ncbi:MAG: hemolysin family protein [Lentimicrobiaceae bacterium]|jgi:CBS domain containing-hemolysin-like protein|nr:hemolysin family protein [Lentimicrobiaceae bacterium]
MQGWLVVAVTLLFSAFFSGIEIAFVSANKLQMEIDRKKGLFSGKIFSGFLKEPSRFISTLLLGNNIVLVIYGMAMGDILFHWLNNFLPGNLHTKFFILLSQTVISTLLILITAEFIPKMLFRINPNSSLRMLSVPSYLAYLLLYPVNIFFTKLSQQLLNLFFKVKITEQNYTFSTTDLDHYLAELSARNIEQSDISQELIMVDKAIEFHKVKLRECMVPRNEIVAIEQGEPIEALHELFIRSKHSKILIYKLTNDEIVGYAHSHDLFGKPQSIVSILHPLLIVPETMPAENLLQTFIREHKSIAVVVDEFGGTSGMVTMEDIIEEIFGEIYDEHDLPEREEKQLSKHEFIFSGRLEIDHLNEKFKLSLPVSDEYETLAGLIIHLHEKIPEQNDEIVTDSFIFTILNASENRIELVKITKI